MRNQKFASGSYTDIPVVSCGQDEHGCTAFRVLEGEHQGKVVSIPVYMDAGERTYLTFSVPPFNRPVTRWTVSRPDTERPSGGPIPRPDEQEPEAHRRPVPPPQASPPSWAADMLTVLGDIRDSLDAIAVAIRDSHRPSPCETTAEPTPEPVKFPTPWSLTPQQVETYLLARGWEVHNDDVDVLFFNGKTCVNVPQDMSEADYQRRVSIVVKAISNHEGRTRGQVQWDIASTAETPAPAPADIAATIKPTAEQVERYLRASGWKLRSNDGVWACYIRDYKMIEVSAFPGEVDMAVTLHILAEHEGRELDQVKRDIAAIIVEPEPAAPTLPEPQPPSSETINTWLANLGKGA